MCILNTNHIQGSVNAKINLGLFYNDELVSLMTFGKCRFDKKHEYEMLKFCNKIGYHIPEAASKILKYFEINYKPTSIISYVDRRWSNGTIIKDLGFNFVQVTDPNYWYVIDDQIFSKDIFKRQKITKFLNIFDKSKSEVENMKANGYHRIFDCGNLVFEKLYH